MADNVTNELLLEHLKAIQAKLSVMVMTLPTSRQTCAA